MEMQGRSRWRTDTGAAARTSPHAMLEGIPEPLPAPCHPPCWRGHQSHCPHLATLEGTPELLPTPRHLAGALPPSVLDLTAAEIVYIKSFPKSDLIVIVSCIFFLQCK